MIWINLLLCYNWLSEWMNNQKEEWKEWIRQQVGPSPHVSYILLPNEDVVPSSICSSKPNQALHYVAEDQSIRPLHGSAKMQKLPWLSLQCKVGDTIHDFSDWINDLHLYASPSLLSLVRLAAIVHNIYIPEEHCKIEVILRDGSEESYVCKGRRQLCKELPILHRETLPYDVDGLFF